MMTQTGKGGNGWHDGRGKRGVSADKVRDFNTPAFGSPLCVYSPKLFMWQSPVILFYQKCG